MMGYYKNPEATKEASPRTGSSAPGDIGEIDKGRVFKITGRIKDLIVTSGGKNISPQNIENSLKASKYVEQVAVIGDNRKYLSALIVRPSPNSRRGRRTAVFSSPTAGSSSMTRRSRISTPGKSRST
jgi:long-chain acyl-CoA synthetase